MAVTKMIHIRVDEEMGDKAAKTLEAMGLSMSEAVRLFLHRVVAEQALPFDIKVPNETTRAAMAEADEIVRAKKTQFSSYEQLIENIEENSKQ
ncbi:MAG: type II toxin-antitoxin system RelB/DinJ family antitoxin [Candidatus Obscuribacter sp.]|nr:type II toxin-antitoxin system RelB/DinJ family antitoxin [Candidatus Obscuribacter sp.]